MTNDKKKENRRINFKNQAEFVKKATNSACMLYVAKNVKITDNNQKALYFVLLERKK